MITTPRNPGLLSRLLARLRAAVTSAPATPSEPAISRSARDESAAFHSLVEALPDAALVLDAASSVIAANRAAHEVVGRISLGHHIAQSARQPELAEAVRTAFATGRTANFLLSLPPPAERRLDGSASRLSGFGDGPGAPAAIIVLRDISEREALARMRMEFVANASHELRTPLTALAGFIETLSGAAKDDPAARERFLGIMGKEAQRMTRLIDDLLLLSRVEMRAHVLPREKADLVLAANEAIKLTASAAQREGTTVTTAFAAAPTTISGDHDELVQAIQNLLSNAIKYGKPGGRIDLRIDAIAERRGGTALKLSVTDDGPGIAPEHLPRLTERFYRVNTAESRQKGGTGLGLAIVKHIVVRHRGRIEVDSELGRGTTVSLIFPVALDSSH